MDAGNNLKFWRQTLESNWFTTSPPHLPITFLTIEWMQNNNKYSRYITFGACHIDLLGRQTALGNETQKNTIVIKNTSGQRNNQEGNKNQTGKNNDHKMTKDKK